MAVVTTPRVVVVTTDGCHLCEDALAVVATVCRSLDVTWAPREIADLPEPERTKWRDLIPVVLVDGEVHEVLRVDPERLRGLLT